MASFETLSKLYVLRLLLLGAGLQAAQICCVALVTHRLDTTIGGLFSKPASVLLPLLLPAVAIAFAIYWAEVAFLERRPLHELPLASATSTLLFGLGSGFLLFAFVFGALAVHGTVRYDSFAGFDGVPAAALLFTTGVVFEELIFRGTILRLAEASLGTAPALLLSALLFSASHLENEGVTAIGVIALFAGGLTLGLCYCLSRNLWLPIGAHLGWNFTMGALVGAAVSGHETRGAFRFAVLGPDWVSGGRFGPESSVYSMLLFVLLAIALGWLVVRRNNWTARHFRLRAP
jgi:uncharacterized protein